jgi:signal transduction histidine kinase
MPTPDGARRWRSSEPAPARVRSGAEVALHDAEVRRAEVTAAIAHELRTPLTTIRGFTETLLVRADLLGADDRRHMLEISLRTTVELTHRISALLEHAKLEADHIVVEPRTQRLAPAIEAAVDACSGLLSAHRLERDVPPDLVVGVDEVALDHVVGNLVSNAVKFAPDGSVIRVSATVTDPTTVVISVEDRGGGIPAEHLPHVFDRFYRGEGADRRRRGSGIGLAIVKRYVELAGGRVWIESTEGEGTTVRFTLPLAVVDPGEPDGGDGEDQLLALHTSSQASSPRCQPSIR